MNWGTVAQIAVAIGGITLWIAGWKHLRRPGPEADPDEWANRNSW